MGVEKWDVYLVFTFTKKLQSSMGHQEAPDRLIKEHEPETQKSPVLLGVTTESILKDWFTIVVSVSSSVSGSTFVIEIVSFALLLTLRRILALSSSLCWIVSKRERERKTKRERERFET